MGGINLSFKLGAILICHLFLPSFVYVAFGASSLSAGLVLSTIINFTILALSGVKFRAVRLSRLTFVVFATLFLLASPVLIRGKIEDVLALAGFFLLMLAGLGTAELVASMTPKQLRITIQNLAVFSAGVGLMGSFNDVKFLNYARFPADVFPFSEPSHFAIFCGPIIAMGFFISRRLVRYFLLSTTALLVALLPSLTLAFQLLLVLGIVMAGSLRKNPIIAVALSVGAGLVLIYSLPLLLPSDILAYFEDRLSFEDSTNLSVLVYQQGWERGWLIIGQTAGIGMGFNNLENGAVGRYGTVIYSILNADKNLADGGFVGAKLIGEFGIFGVIVLLFFLRSFVTSLTGMSTQISRARKPPEVRSNSKVADSDVVLFLAFSAVVFSFSEFFVRGIGYLSMYVFLISFSHGILSSIAIGKRM